MERVAIVCYSHSEYGDVWPMYFGQMKKFMPDARLYLFTNLTKQTYKVPHDVIVKYYDDKKPYDLRMRECIWEIDEETVIFHHEDMILTEQPDMYKMTELVDLMENYNVSYIKLLKGGQHTDIKLEDMPLDNLYWIPHSGMSFAIQPTIWNIHALRKVFNGSNSSKYLLGHDMKTKPDNFGPGTFEMIASTFINDWCQDMIGLYWYAGETKRGMSHWDSSVYPHGNMISKGKWVYSEYRKELTELHAEYEIDKNVRGTV